MDPSLHSQILSRLDQHRTLSLARLRPGGWPQPTTVGFAHENLTLYLLCSPNSHKAANTGREGRVSLAIDHDVPQVMDITGLSMAARARRVSYSHGGNAHGRRPVISARKAPPQRRSSPLVADILEAAFRVLVRAGCAPDPSTPPGGARRRPGAELSRGAVHSDAPRDSLPRQDRHRSTAVRSAEERAPRASAGHRTTRIGSGAPWRSTTASITASP